MTRRPLIIALLALPLCVTSPVIAEDTPVFGQVATTRKTAIKIAPNPQSAAATAVNANTDLRWIRGARKGKYLRVMVPKGPIGWVLEADVRKVADADLASIALEGSAQPCVSPPTLNACTTTKPTGCAAADSAHGLVNRLKRTVPPEGTANHADVRNVCSVAERGRRPGRPGRRDSACGEGQDQEHRDRRRHRGRGVAGPPDRLSVGRLATRQFGELVNCNLKREANNDLHISVTENKRRQRV